MGIFKSVLLILLSTCSLHALAANYSFPSGPLPPNCSRDASRIVCSGDVNLAWHDTVSVTEPGVTWQVNGVLRLQNARVNQTTLAEDFGIVANRVTSNQAQVRANIETKGAIQLGDRTEITGNLRAAEITGPLESGVPQAVSEVRVYGNVRSSGRVWFYARSEINGNISADTVRLFADNVRVNGSLQANGDIIVEHEGHVTGNVFANSLRMLDSQARIGGNVIVDTAINVGYQGVIEGNARASEIYLANEAVIQGDAHAPLIELKWQSVIQQDTYSVHIRNDNGFIQGTAYCDSSNGETPETCATSPPAERFSCEQFTELARYGIIGHDGFTYGNNSEINENFIREDDSTPSGPNTPTPNGLLDRVTLEFPPLEPASFPSFSATANRTNAENIPPGSYNLIETSKNNSFSSLIGGTYYINRLELDGRDSTVELGPGRYFIREIVMDNRSHIVINPSGKVELFIQNQIYGQNNIFLNSEGQTTNLNVYLYDGATFIIGNFNENVNNVVFNFNGLLYSPFANTRVEFGNNTEIRGGVLSAGTVSVGNNTNIYYTPELQQEIIASQGCDPEVPAVDHYRILQPASVISCIGAPVEIQACANAECSALYEDPVSVTLSSSPAVRWQGGALPAPVTGNATFSFEGGRGTVGMQRIEGGTATISLAANDPAFVEPTLCYDSSGTELRDSCTTEFRPAGLLIEVDNTQDSSPVAGLPFNTHIRAVETDMATGACQARLQNQTQPVRFGAKCVNPDACQPGQVLSLDGTAIALDASAPVTAVDLAFDNEGRAVAHSLYSDAGEMRLHAELSLPEEPAAPGGDISDPAIALTGTSNDFVSRPYKLLVSVLDENGNPVSPTPDDQPGYRAAGEDFSALVHALNAQGNPTPNFGLENDPSLVNLEFFEEDLPANSPFSTASHLITSGEFQHAGSPGAMINTQVRWLEAGFAPLRAAVSNHDYLGGGNIPERPTTLVGRFYPYEIQLISSSVLSQCIDNFSYLEQPNIELEYELRAFGRTGVRTHNYSQNLYPDLLSVNVGSDLIANDRIETQQQPDWDQGVLSLQQLDASVLRTATPDGPFDLQFGLSAGAMLDPIELPDFTSTSFEYEDMARLGSPLRLIYGRLQLMNIGGPEDDDLLVQGQVEYWDGSQFVRHHQDSCSELEADQLNRMSGEVNPQPDGNGLGINDGVIPPGALYWQSTGEVGEFLFEYQAPEWWQFNWNEDGDDTDNPTAIGSFGQFRGNDRIIFWGERLTY